ncbi:type II toxin-antitoxin system RelE/ParE family toxin [Mucilaginibacter sp. OK283]|jgi:plasmid stabilization system protein ParE|uniref:type II toxin-antitoxin system RelE/ParE family toxin n=1 Tax=Mucilaginibacter sp. OK283 TaxID=1881049 RepID=UPI0008CAF606|nr:type II toxin-antitoxin system RelE/ParE family toxin [Mucilaginibacter sp. OK283]SEO65344.1 Plasmid stabilization system protein ParE [Mucilaginibacter sp. OK283]
MIYTVVFSLTAIETFDAIKFQIQERFGNKIVAEFEERTLKVLETLSLSPEIFQSLKQAPHIRKGFIHKNCAMFYQVKATQIEILFFWDNRQEPIL